MSDFYGYRSYNYIHPPSTCMYQHLSCVMLAEWVYRPSLSAFWADIPTDAIILRVTDVNDIYIVKIPYASGKYTFKLRTAAPNYVYVAYGSQERKIAWTGGLEVLTIENGTCSWLPVDMSLATPNYGNVEGRSEL